MQLGIIGLPMSGKTSLFDLMNEGSNKNINPAKTNMGLVKVPDERIDFLIKMYKPKKNAYAQLEVLDIPGLVPGSDKGASIFLDAIRNADALLHVVRAFDDDSVPHINEQINPLKDIETINYELLMADLELVEKRIERIQANKKKSQMQKELDLLEKLKDTLSNEQNINALELDDDETELLQSYQFMTMKPMLICLNISEADLQDQDKKYKAELIAYSEDSGIPVVELAINIEREISELEEEEKQIFLNDLEIDEPGLVKITRMMYKSLGLISFFTVGEDEVKAWTIEKDTNAKKAAGKIHSDIERGFIRAEIVDYHDLKELGGMNAIKEKGLFRLEGKEYIIKDGDIIHFRFNV